MGVLYKNTKINNIIDAVMKIDGKIVNNLPLQMKIDGVIINFMMYGPTLEEIKMLMPISPIGFDAEKISNIINKIGKFADSIEVTFENGEFICNKPLIITTSNVTLKGDPNTILRRNGDFSSYNDGGYCGVVNFKGKSENELEKLVIEGISIDGDRDNAPNQSNGIYCSYVGSSTKKGITIKDCVIKNNRNIGICIAYFSSNNSIIGNIINNNYYDGIEFTSSTNNTITDNIISKNYIGIGLNSSKNNSILGNVLNDNGSGICVYNSNNSTFSGNICTNNTTGIKFDTSLKCIITGNNVNKNIQEGIYLDKYCSNNTITGNNVNENNIGIRLNSTNAGNIIQGNIIYNNKSSTEIVSVGNKYNFNIQE